VVPFADDPYSETAQRETQEYLSAVGTAGPAARPALAFTELLTRSLDMLSPGFGFFYGDGPADPFITRQWRDVFPGGEGSLVGGKGFSQIRGNSVYDAAGDCFLRHMFFRANPSDIVAGDWTQEKQNQGKFVVQALACPATIDTRGQAKACTTSSFSLQNQA